MLVKQLKKELNKLDPNLCVTGYSITKDSFIPHASKYTYTFQGKKYTRNDIASLLGLSHQRVSMLDQVGRLEARVVEKLKNA